MKYNRIPSTLNVGIQIIDNSKLRIAENVLVGIVHRTEIPFDPGTNLAVKVGMLSVSGSIDIPMKVIKCDRISESEYDLFLNYTEKDFHKIREIEELIQDLA
ncbi:PilZ domain-containing protein [Leptospira wolffii]|uniref:PilZ domain-containing protein n=1 Tax=Leptospira wolffii TaxID=409998 RepID=A0A2M9Z8N0_9LEPT|nr:PilZ domain-containing protein [Leptospira wolffii]PJZ64780.1 PilZ domain-containing protein [Leptospira wolffii]TGK56923.1 PilZ domain-containing protein [Leptospira wolffii]TGK70957.1 PilZ domain-containing protein [Leptospira wolffii]TGK75648.1 PilZ domain-containing protein [Leptospira wolffii]TGL32695.1 PilZ domain-containing protein [Leptospira wolffii]